ncbi:MAG: S41 family peptidase [Opitutaceae bacterium]|nr:S41 family peptidase [Opitutaceae bacterium]
MLKRFLAITAAVALGYLLAHLAGSRLGAPTWWPDRDRDRSVRYFRDVVQLVHEDYVDESKSKYDDLTRTALEGMVNQLDPHSEFLDAEEFADIEDELKNEISGIGIQVEQRSGRIVVITPIAGTPAERAGIRRGDRLLKVDGKALENMTLDKTVKLLRGDPGSTVTVTMERPPQSQPLDFALKRERIRLDSVRNPALLPGGIGYLQVTQFSERTGEEFTRTLAGLERQDLRALILDLRNNPGGLLEAAIEVCDSFFDRGQLIVYTQGRAPDSRENYYSDGMHPRRSYPVAVLVNGGTASAAEIVAGALKDTQRAVVVGELTFGKGSVQSVIELQKGEGLRLTTARYYTPSGITIHEHGIAPQIEIAISPDDEAKLRLQQSRTDLLAPAEFADRFGFQPITDRQLQAACEVLAGVLALGEGQP